MIEFTPTELMYLSIAIDEDLEYLAQCDVDIYKVFNLIAKLIRHYTELETVVIEYQENNE